MLRKYLKKTIKLIKLLRFIYYLIVWIFKLFLKIKIIKNVYTRLYDMFWDTVEFNEDVLLTIRYFWYNWFFASKVVNEWFAEILYKINYNNEWCDIDLWQLKYFFHKIGFPIFLNLEFSYFRDIKEINEWWDFFDTDITKNIEADWSIIKFDRFSRFTIYIQSYKDKLWRAHIDFMMIEDAP